MQLKDKLDFSFLASGKKLTAKIVFWVLRFAIVAAVSFLFFKLAATFSIFSTTSSVPREVMIVIYGIIFALSLISCTAGLVKNLYFADDNKVLITFPVEADLIFVSRFIVYYFFELTRSLFLTVPIFLGYGIFAKVSALFYLWLPVAFVFLSALPVVLGAVLSIPAMYVYRFMKKCAPVRYGVYTLAVAAAVYIAVKLIGLIPSDINLIFQGGLIRAAIIDVLDWCRLNLYPANLAIVMIFGLSGRGFMYFGLLVLAVIALIAVSFFASRPLFFSMVSKSFEFEKKIGAKKLENVPHGRAFAFLKAETVSLMRSGLVVSFFATYIIVPVLIYLINKIFAAMDLRESGKNMVYAFNVLLISLPMLASNALVSTMYSRDGRAAYIKKTMPLSPFFPLISKLIPVAVCSAVSLAVSAAIAGSFFGFGFFKTLLLCVFFVLLQWGHILWSGMLDLMNPLNDQYATSGGVNSNPNETKSTIIAFIASAVCAVYAFMLFPEGVTKALVKFALAGLAFFLVALYMYYAKIKAYYFEK